MIKLYPRKKTERGIRSYLRRTMYLLSPCDEQWRARTKKPTLNVLAHPAKQFYINKQHTWIAYVNFMEHDDNRRQLLMTRQRVKTREDEEGELGFVLWWTDEKKILGGGVGGGVGGLQNVVAFGG